MRFVFVLLLTLALGCDGHAKFVTVPPCPCVDCKCEVNEHCNAECKCVPNLEAR